MDSGSDESAASLELASDIMDLLSDDIISPVRTELDADVEYEGACSSEEGELDADVEHEGACWSDEDELEFDISTDEESDLETDGADQLPFESQPSDSSLPMASENEDWKQPLYPGAKITKIDSFLLLVQFMLRFHLTGIAFQYLLKLVSAHLPDSKRCVSSLYMLKKWCLKLFPGYKCTPGYYCVRCTAPASEKNHCKSCGGKNIGRFVMADIASQLKTKFKDPQFWDALKARPLSKTDRLSDIYDGMEYKKHSKPGGFLCKRTYPANVSFLFNTDGVALFRSSSTDIWPIFLAVNELPPSMRFSKKYIILGGLWYGKSKPLMLTYLQPLVDQLNNLYRQGIQVCTTDGIFTSHAIAMLCSADLPARALISNMKVFNGAHACSTCEDEGCTVPGNTLHRIWPFTDLNILRTKDRIYSAIVSTVHQGQSAPVKACVGSILSRSSHPGACTNGSNVVLGYKGFPVLAGHPPFDVTSGMVTDYMHCVLLGVAKTLLYTWLDHKHCTKDFYIGRQSETLNDGMRQLKVPDIIKRSPRSLEEKKHWKASEWQSWLLFYSLPLLSGILPTPYYLHYCALVCAIAILLGDNILEQDLEKAQVLLEEFYRHAALLYGIKALTMNIHQLRHLVYHVRNWGPLWSFSCFGFESLNGDLKVLFHGTRDMSEQMIFNFTAMNGLRSSSKLMSSKGLALMNTLTGESQRYGRKTQKYSPKIWRIGNHKVTTLCASLVPLVEGACGFTPSAVLKFWRLLKDNTVYYSTEYSKTASRASYAVSYLQNSALKFGLIQYFIEVRGGQQVSVLAILHILHSEPALAVPHLYVAEETGLFTPVPIGSIVAKCILIKTNAKTFIGYFPSCILATLT